MQTNARRPGTKVVLLFGIALAVGMGYGLWRRAQPETGKAAIERFETAVRNENPDAIYAMGEARDRSFMTREMFGRVWRELVVPSMAGWKEVGDGVVQTSNDPGSDASVYMPYRNTAGRPVEVAASNRWFPDGYRIELFETVIGILAQDCFADPKWPDDSKYMMCRAEALERAIPKLEEIGIRELPSRKPDRPAFTLRALADTYRRLAVRG